MSGRSEAPPGVRVVLDVRPLQEPHRAPTTAAYLDGLVGAFDADPASGESFVILMRVDLPDPMERFGSLAIVGRRMLPPASLLSAASPAGDPLLLRGASIGAGWGIDRTAAGGAVVHAAGSALPLGAGLPLVVTLLDLAPWRLPDVYQRTAGARFGARLRRRTLRHASAVIVGSGAVKRAAKRLLRVPDDRLFVVPFAARTSLVALDVDVDAHRSVASHYGLGRRYFVYGGRFDARHDLLTLLGALRSLAASARPADLPPEDGWPPRVVVTGASPDDRAAIARVAARLDAGDHLSFVPTLPDTQAHALIGGARAVLVPALTDAAGLAALDGLAVGVPVVATGVDGLPEIVSGAGLIVPPREPERLATAMAAAYADDRLHGGLVEKARASAAGARPWADVARETRAVYASVTSRAP